MLPATPASVSFQSRCSDRNGPCTCSCSKPSLEVPLVGGAARAAGCVAAVTFCAFTSGILMLADSNSSLMASLGGEAAGAVDGCPHSSVAAVALCASTYSEWRPPTSQSGGYRGDHRLSCDVKQGQPCRNSVLLLDLVRCLRGLPMRCVPFVLRWPPSRALSDLGDMSGYYLAPVPPGKARWRNEG